MAGAFLVTTVPLNALQNYHSGAVYTTQFVSLMVGINCGMVYTGQILRQREGGRYRLCFLAGSVDGGVLNIQEHYERIL